MDLPEKTIAIRTTFGTKTGIGHLVRMSFLADALAASERHILFLLDFEDERALPFIRDFQTFYIYSQRPDVLDPEIDAKACIDLLQPFNIEMVMLDSYKLDLEWERAIKKRGYPVAVADDIRRTHECDILIDQAWSGAAQTFSRYDNLVPKDCLTLLGPDYAMIDPVYSPPPLPSPEQTAILFSLGGGGDLRLIFDILIELLSLTRLDKNIAFWVVLGPLSKNKSLIFDLSKKDRRIHPVDSPPSLYPYYLKTALFVGALGTSLYETAALRIPALTFSLADNQVRDIAHLEDFGHYFHLSLDEFKQPGKMAKLIGILISNLDRLRALRRDPLICFDGKGAERIADVICHGKLPSEPGLPLVPKDEKMHHLSQEVRLRAVQDTDINHYLESRNLIQNMNNMTTANPIAPMDHYVWWFTKQRISYLFEKNCQKALYIWHELVDYNNQSFLIGGWFVCGEAVGFEMAAAALKWQLDMTEKEYPGIPWIAIIKKTNKFVNLLNRYMGFVAVDPGGAEYEAIRQFFGDPSPGQFNFVKK